MEVNVRAYRNLQQLQPEGFGRGEPTHGCSYIGGAPATQNACRTLSSVQANHSHHCSSCKSPWKIDPNAPQPKAVAAQPKPKEMPAPRKLKQKDSKRAARVKNEILSVPITNVEQRPPAGASTFPYKELHLLAARIKAVGQFPPLLAFQRGTAYVVWDPAYYLEACRIAGLSQVRLALFGSLSYEKAERAYLQYATRLVAKRAKKHLECAFMLHKIASDHQWIPAAVGRAVGINESDVRRTIRLVGLSPEAQKLCVEGGPLHPDRAVKLVGYPAAFQKQMAKLLLKEGVLPDNTDSFLRTKARESGIDPIPKKFFMEMPFSSGCPE